MHEQRHFSATVSSRLADLQTQLDTLTATQFAEASPLLNVVKAGVRAFHGELAKQYVSRYSGNWFTDKVVKPKTSSEAKTVKTMPNPADNTEITEYGRKCAKVFLTALSITHNALKALKKYGSVRWRSQQVNDTTEFGKFFINHGYHVATGDKQQWELQDKVTKTGFHIYKLVVKDDDEHVYTKHDHDQDNGPLKRLHGCLQTYYRVGHVTSASAKKRPSNIFEILCWISGLPSNNVYDDLLHDAVSDLFVDPAKQVTVGDLAAAVVGDEPVPAYPHSIELERTQAAVTRLCSKSYDVLATILGYGDAYTMYAVDFGNNALNFHYPPKAGDCLQMLIDMLRRLLPPLRFLHSQCKLGAEFHGWSECFYGKDVRTTKWTCTDHSSDEVTCQPNCQPKGKANCQPTSPLQSYLSDCLVGRLPHELSSIGCKYDCRTCSKSQPGQPCLTPLGFRAFSGSAKTGKHICDVLDEFFNNEKLLALFTFSPQPPASLPEHFGFALSLAAGLNASNANKHDGVITLQDALETSVKETSMDLYNEASAFITAFRNAYHSTHGGKAMMHPTATNADLKSLSMRDSCMVAAKDNVHCGPYLSSLYSDAYYYLAPKHCNLYLSWAVYLPWTLYRYLQGLFDSFCNISCQDWGCRGCLQNEKCKKGKHGEDYNCKCRGIVECRGVMSVFHTYGFSFGDASKLMSTDEWRYCRNFYAQFKNVLKSEYFNTLFEKCDEFLFRIRSPFIWLNVALWLLSLLYLIHIMVIRLDLLHIKSHLHSPSSHRIAAQSLLAAARVNKLNRVFYLQP
ncbi:hypothetical protein, conserved [Babesia bigemina]|uniref:C3H1-type domain-containing protein n=1 Tax=Babesia bigemina TaxID=5866 RepID=A0A061BT76_BABBI|nr:hypothetical protein, conserved [Babesia bigemina]CDR71714.1 hypothetical protein, conserved [Babesia bigemina]|eukprot:XP_012770660.1 hypothetical protein, conserved [Babesia bigemina]